MLVFLSDVHLTDGTSGQTIKPTAFRIFAESVKKLAAEVKPLQEIKVVLLGDIFDVIRSSRWLEKQVRPWDDPSTGQGEAVGEIVDGILGSQANSDSIGYIHSIADAVKVPFSVEYVIGNHDKGWDSAEMLAERGLLDTFRAASSVLANRGLSAEQEREVRSFVRAYALGCVGKPYNINFLDPDNERALYCSQLIYLAYKKVGIDLNVGRSGVTGKWFDRVVFPQEIRDNSAVIPAG